MPVAIFDLDGTLANNDDLAVAAARDGLRRYYQSQGEIPVIPPPDQILGLIGLPASDYFAGMLPPERQGDLPGFMKMVQQREYDLLAAGRGAVYPGVPEVIEELLSDGWRLGLASNCMRQYLDGNLDFVVRREWFEIALCLEDNPTKTLNVGDALRFLGGGPGVMIGDRSGDIEAGSTNGLPTIGCAWGHGGYREVKGADRVIKDIRELPQVMLEVVER